MPAALVSSETARPVRARLGLARGSRAHSVGSFALLFACIAWPGCRSGDPPPGREEVGSPREVQARTPEPSSSGKALGVQLPESVKWHTWEDGLRQARLQGKPMLVLVYADWCPHCRKLAPVFAEPEVVALARQFIMVKQDHDEQPAWLAPFDREYGGYVPRIFFFDSNGKIKAEVTSGHPRYPFFYAAEQPDNLKRSMRRAVGS